MYKASTAAYPLGQWVQYYCILCVKCLNKFSTVDEFLFLSVKYFVILVRVSLLWILMEKNL